MLRDLWTLLQGGIVMYSFYPCYQTMGNTSQRKERIVTEEIWQRNIGKRITVHMTYDGSELWRDKIFSGILKEVGRDFFIIHDIKLGKDVMLLNINLDYMTFEEPPILQM
jgi:spore germination protein Q